MVEYILYSNFTKEQAVKKQSFFREYIKKSDTLLLLLCVLATVYGIVLISSSTRIYGSHKFVIVQSASLVLGVALYFMLSLIDIDTIAGKWKLVLVFNVAFICSLFVFGEAGNTVNRAWLRFGGIGVQPAEVVKITFTILLAKQLVYLRSKRGINHPLSVAQLILHFAMMFGLIVVASSDLGSALVYLFIFIVMLYVAGLKFYWFAAGIACVAAAAPFVWTHLFTERHRSLILAPYDSTIDTTGLGITWQVSRSKAAIAVGGFGGSGLYNGVYTQSGSVPQQRTDFIFSAAGEELGFIGCLAIILLLTLIIVRCVYVGIKSNHQLSMYVCFGFAAMLIFQMLENIGMCLGLTPVIGLTLPFFSYGGSSIITMFAAMGVVSGIRRRPKPSSFSLL